jgi:hypothetical protein
VLALFGRISHNESSVLGHEPFEYGFIGFAVGWEGYEVTDYPNQVIFNPSMYGGSCMDRLL